MGLPAAAGEADYDGSEAGLPEKQVRTPRGDYFGVEVATPPPGSVPIVDDDERVVIGYRGPFFNGMAKVYDVQGQEVSVVEQPLGHPLIDPIDLILIFGSLGRVAARSLFRTMFEDAAEAGAARALTKGATQMLRLLFRGQVSRELKFTKTVMSHMAQLDRYVPVSIMKLAIKYGKREPDPRGVAGLFQYTIRIRYWLRDAPVGEAAKVRTLKIIVRESDWTVMHFDRFEK